MAVRGRMAALLGAVAIDTVDGVELTYLPDDLRRDPADGFDQGRGFTAVTGRWRPASAAPGDGYDRGVRVTVFRGEQVRFLQPLAGVVVAAGQDRPEERDGRVEMRAPDGAWIDVFWHLAEEACRCGCGSVVTSSPTWSG